MANAKSEDAQAAWSIYRASQYTATLDQINGELVRRGFGPIKERTYTHLRKLQRYGYDRYVPTNQLDVETLRDPVWDTPLRSRYLARRTELDAVLIIVVGEDLLTLRAQMVELSELEAVVAFRGPDAEQWLESARKIVHKSGLMILSGSNEPESITIESIEPSLEAQRIALVSVRFLTVVSPRRFSIGESLPASRLRLHIYVEDSDYFLNTVCSLNVVASAVKSVRIGCDEALSRLDPDRRFVLDPPEILSLNRESPIYLALGMPGTVAGLFVWMLRSMAKAKLDLDKGAASKITAKSAASIDEAHAERIREGTRRQRLVNDLLDRASGPEKSALVPVFIREVARTLSPESSPDELEQTSSEIPTDRLEVLAEEQIIPSMAELTNYPIEDIKAETETSVPEDDLWHEEEGRSGK